MRIVYVCNNPDCRNTIVKLVRDAKDIKGYLDCGECGIGKLERRLGSVASTSKIVVDDGQQGRAVEIDPIIVEENMKRNK